MKRKILLLLSLIMFIIPLFACKNVEKYTSDENDSYHISTFHSGGEKNISCEITDIRAMNYLGSERIILDVKCDGSKEKLPYYELSFPDEDREEFTFTVYSALLIHTPALSEVDYDLLESLDIFESDGNVIIKCDCDEDVKFRVEENTDSSQIVLHIKEIMKEKN